MADRLFFRQLLAGQDFAREDPIARQMVNFVYLIGDRERGEALAVDPAYGVRELVDLLDAEGLKLTGVLATHWHADHVGGDLMGYPIQGIQDLVGMSDVAAPVHIQRPEAEWVKRFTGVSDSDLALHDSGDTVMVGDIEVKLIHTPGHTEGSQCFLVDGKLIAGDTLFLDGCGRTDLPGADPDQMYESLTQRLATISDDTMLYPGHLYSPEPSATMGETRRRNYVFRFPTLEQWRTMFG
jgi:glyoxylase-like metal-dependent hydrolase (beta-lactamase superfamily II)